MTVEVKKPFEFKGNHVNYLHKLSKAGANALKAKFPDGNGGEVETTIQAAIDELATNGGGGSAESLIPKRVIYINPDKETVAGECYPTFAAAKAYIESLNTTEKFCIELPAGEFSEPITLDEKWLIHGNNTIITAPINSNIVPGVDLTAIPSGVFISDCTISGGFVGYHTTSQADLVYVPIYKLNHCRITEFCSDSETEDVSYCLCEYCEIETTRSHNELIAEGTPGAYPYVVQTFHSTILQFGASAATLVYGLHTAIYNVGAHQGSFLNCVLAQQAHDEYSEINVSRLSMAHCVFEGLVIKQQNMNNIFIKDSRLEVLLESSVHMLSITVQNSEVEFTNVTEGSVTITGDTLWVSPDSVCSNGRDVLWSVINDRRLHYIMYSTDGGTTMSNDPTGATHYGILKYLPEYGYYSTGIYMWFPMPE